MRWYRKAANQGVSAAQFNLGVSYANGTGVGQDHREAVRWFRKAAEQGYAKAQYNLGVMYWKGEGVITDYREAYIWFSIAKASGVKEAIDGLSEIDWHNILSQSEIRSARKEAARRMDAIESREKESAGSPTPGKNIAAAPKQANSAEGVFENTWRSVVVVTNGDGQGSGVIIRPNLVATNCHVVDEGGNIDVYKADNRRVDTDTAFAATIRHSDEGKDFCLLDVDGLWGIPATLRKYETLTVGETVYGLGAPKGLDLSLSAGLVSQLRTTDGNRYIQTCTISKTIDNELRTTDGNRYIQTDAAISPGSSGGGLFDSESNLVGLMTWKITDESVEGIGFAIPADLAFEY